MEYRDDGGGWEGGVGEAGSGRSLQLGLTSASVRRPDAYLNNLQTESCVNLRCDRDSSSPTASGGEFPILILPCDAGSSFERPLRRLR